MVFRGIPHTAGAVAWLYLFPQCLWCEKINKSITLMNYVKVRSNAQNYCMRCTAFAFEGEFFASNVYMPYGVRCTHKQTVRCSSTAEGEITCVSNFFFSDFLFISFAIVIRRLDALAVPMLIAHKQNDVRSAHRTAHQASFVFRRRQKSVMRITRNPHYMHTDRIDLRETAA